MIPCTGHASLHGRPDYLLSPEPVELFRLGGISEEASSNWVLAVLPENVFSNKSPNSARQTIILADIQIAAAVGTAQSSKSAYEGQLHTLEQDTGSAAQYKSLLRKMRAVVKVRQYVTRAL